MAVFKYFHNVNQVMVNNDDEDEAFEELLERSTWTSWMEDLKFQTFDKAMFEKAEDSQDLEMISLEKKLKSNLFHDKGLPLEHGLLEKSEKLYEITRKFKYQDETQDSECNITALENSDSEVSESHEITEEDGLNVCDQVQELYADLTVKNQSFLAFKMLKMLEWPLISHEKVGNLIKSLLMELSGNILSKALMESKPDLHFAMSFLTGQAKPKTGLVLLQKTSSSLRTNDKLVNLARLGVRYCSRLDCLREKEQFMNLLLSAIWAQKLNLNGIEVASYGPGSGEHMNVLANYITNNVNQVNKSFIRDLQNYSKAFGPMSVSSVMELFTRKILSTQEDPNQDIFETVDKALELIAEEDKEILLENLMQNEISPYNYNVLDFVLRRMGPKESDPMIAFLHSYTRYGIGHVILN